MLTDTDTLAIAVTPVADIVADTVITDEDTPISFNAITGSHGASADNFENAGRVVSAVTQGAHGSVAFAADGTLTYTPDADYPARQLHLHGHFRWRQDHRRRDRQPSTTCRSP
ncbi:MAG: hypothetical protein IPN78_01850 [Candidatus Accumulibacter sp.]|nr:hypothetical protein [Candidatus Accumulibacter propinquus]